MEINEHHKRNEEGFSLLEILVAIALIGLAVSTAMVNVNNMIRRSQDKAFYENVLLLVRDARYAAVISKRSISVSEHAGDYFSKKRAEPEDMSVFIESDVLVLASGMCSSGKIQARQEERRLAFEVVPFGCQLNRVASP